MIYMFSIHGIHKNAMLLQLVTEVRIKQCMATINSQNSHKQIDGLVQEGRNSSALAMELCLSYTKPSKSCLPNQRLKRLSIHLIPTCTT